MNELTTINEWWTTYRFNNAVAYFGLWVEGKLNELDNKGKPKHDIETLMLSVEERKKRSVPIRYLANLM